MTGDEWYRAASRRRAGGGIRAGPAITDELLTRQRHDRHSATRRQPDGRNARGCGIG